jgi:hypothetical protein
MNERRVPKAGDLWCLGKTSVQIVRVSTTHGWVDMWCTSADGWMWSGRQSLPLAEQYTFVKARER